MYIKFNSSFCYFTKDNSPKLFSFNIILENTLSKIILRINLRLLMDSQTLSIVLQN